MQEPLAAPAQPPRPAAPKASAPKPSPKPASVGAPMTESNPHSASWVVAGKPVNLPATPKVMEVKPEAPPAPIKDPHPRHGKAPANARSSKLIGALALALALGALVAWRFMADEVAIPGIPRTDVENPATKANTNTNANTNANRVGEGVNAGEADAGGDVKPAVSSDATNAHEVNGNAKATADEPTVQDEPRKAVRSGGDGPDRARAEQYSKALAALSRAMSKKGVRTRDDEELDNARAAATGHQKARRWDEAMATLAKAEERLALITFDRAFVERKLVRFNEAFDRASAQQRAAVDEIAAQALAELSAGKFAAANRTLEEGFAKLARASR